MENATKKFQTAVPDQVDATMKASLESAAQAVRRGIETDIEGARLKARAIVDSVYRAQSRRAMWMWVAIGLVAGALLFGVGFLAGRAPR